MDEYGDQSLSTVEMYDPETDAWAGKANMPTVRSNVSVSVVDGKIYAIGGSKMKKIQVPRGFNTGSEELPTVEMYDPATDTWTQKADMPTPRKTKTCVVDSKIYAIGGWLTTNEQSQLDTVEVYDPATDTWAKAQSMNHARCSAAISVVNGEIYAVGGIGWPPNRDQSGRYLSSPYLSNVEVFNPKTNQWQERTEMSVPKANHSTSVIDGKIYVMGGYFVKDKKLKTLSAIEAYDPATDRWTQESDMIIGKFGHATEVVDGQIYILGGSGGVGKGLLTSVEVYDLREVSQRVNSTGKL
jgi:N-acetylneuraminic acid mutarotase